MRIASQILQLGFAMTVVTVMAAFGLYSLVIDGRIGALPIVVFAGMLNFHLWRNAQQDPDYTFVPDTRRGPVATIVLIGLGLGAYLMTAKHEVHRRADPIYDATNFQQTFPHDPRYQPNPEELEQFLRQTEALLKETKQEATKSNGTVGHGTRILYGEQPDVPEDAHAPILEEGALETGTAEAEAEAEAEAWTEAWTTN